MFGIGRRRAVVAAAAATACVVGVFVAGTNIGTAAGTTNGDPITFGAVPCAASVGSIHLTQPTDVTVQAIVPNQVDQGASYQVTIPGGAASLPHLGQGLPISQFKDLATTILFSSSSGSATVTDAVASSPNATWNPNDGTGDQTKAFNVTHDATTVTFTTPGPMVISQPHDGTLTTPDITVSITAPMANATITTYAVQVNTTATVSIGDAVTSCPIPHADPQTDGISATVVGTGGPTTTSQPPCRKVGATGCPVTTTTTQRATTTTSVGGGGSSTSTSIQQTGAQLSISDSQVDRPDKGKAKTTFTISLSQPAASKVSVKYETADGTAVAPTDYQHKKGSLSFSAGQTSKTITVNAIGGLIGQPDKTFSVVLSSPKGAGIADGTGIGTIHDKHLPGISIDDATIARPAKGSKKLTFTLHLTKPAAAGQTVKVAYATADLTAHNKVDYNGKHGTITFKKNSTTATITISVKASATEGDVVFIIQLSNPVNGIITDNLAAGTITG
jgi:hypothetical protein